MLRALSPTDLDVINGRDRWRRGWSL